MTQAWRSDLEANYITLQEAHLTLQKRCRTQQAIIERQTNNFFNFETGRKIDRTIESRQSPVYSYLLALKSLVNSIHNNSVASETDIAACLIYHEKVHELIRSFPLAFDSTTKNMTPNVQQVGFENEGINDDWNFNLNTNFGYRIKKEDIDQLEYNGKLSSCDPLREDDTSALKIEQVIKESKRSPEKILIVLLRHVSSLLKMITPHQKAQIMNAYVRCDDHIHGIVMDFIESYLQIIPKKNSDVNFTENYLFEDCGSGTLTSKENNLKLDSIDEEEEKYMETLPENIRLRFREIGFAKWTKEWIPVLVLSPYDVIGVLREKWKLNYESHKNRNRPMKHLVVWYGSRYEDEMFGWVTELIPYDKAAAKGVNLCPAHVLKKIESGEKLTWKEKVIADAFKEVEEALELPKSDRWIRIGEGNCKEINDGNEKEKQKRSIASSPLTRVRKNDRERAVQEVNTPSRKHKARKTSNQFIMSSRNTSGGQRNGFEKESYTGSNSSNGVDYSKISTSSLSCMGKRETNKEKMVAQSLMERKADEILSDANFIGSILEAYEKLNILLTSGAPNDLITLMSEELKKKKQGSA